MIFFFFPTTAGRSLPRRGRTPESHRRYSVRRAHAQATADPDGCRAYARRILYDTVTVI